MAWSRIQPSLVHWFAALFFDSRRRSAILGTLSYSDEGSSYDFNARYQTFLPICFQIWFPWYRWNCSHCALRSNSKKLSQQDLVSLPKLVQTISSRWFLFAKFFEDLSRINLGSKMFDRQNLKNIFTCKPWSSKRCTYSVSKKIQTSGYFSTAQHGSCQNPISPWILPIRLFRKFMLFNADSFTSSESRTNL